jgi:hypothetical protein
MLRPSSLPAQAASRIGSSKTAACFENFPKLANPMIVPAGKLATP